MSDNSYFHGSDTYIGHCPVCGERTNTNYNEICEDCMEDEPVQCHKCLDWVHPSHITQNGCCIVCDEYDANEFATKFIEKVEVMQIVDEMISEIKINCKPLSNS